MQAYPELESKVATRWLEQPGEVLDHLLAERAARRRGVLLVVTETVGGALRAEGALAAVGADGAMAGYVSNGCVDADIALQAVAALETGRIRRLRYGAGSPWPDIRLPCGGSMELALIPDPDPAVLVALAGRLAARQTAWLTLDAGGIGMAEAAQAPPGGQVFALDPRPRLRLAGRGAAMAALARLGVAAGFEVIAAAPDADDLAAMRGYGVAETHVLTVPDAVPEVADDPLTAVVLLFHDHEWEPALLRQAVEGPAGFIGALGSRRTHAQRLERLRALGVPEAALARIVGPLGLVRSLHDANMIAVSALAQVVEALAAQGARGAEQAA